MMTRIEVLFPEFCSLFADSSNVRYLERCLPDAEFDTWWQIAFMAAEVVFGLLTLLFAVMFLRNSLRKKTVYVKEDK